MSECERSWAVVVTGGGYEDHFYYRSFLFLFFCFSFSFRKAVERRRRRIGTVTWSWREIFNKFYSGINLIL